mmetsp:Transcript_50192/g.79501  ORF Transcript_50192/g.79501 Transcript_50192/m.79501 type:complete len:526 (+) Transcript_50192:56-1633(+)
MENLTDHAERCLQAVPIFTRWYDDTGTAVDVRLRWHTSIPNALPNAADDTICLVQICVPPRSTAVLCVGESIPEHLEARLQSYHLVGETWQPETLRRLMEAMAAKANPGVGGESTSDTVVLRRGPGHMVIDVFFGDAGAGTGSRDISMRLGSQRKVVELLNARPCASAPRTVAVELLRAVAAAQSEHRGRIATAQKQLEAGRFALLDIQTRWDKACSDVTRGRYDRLRRWILLLQAKINKEHALRAELTGQSDQQQFSVTAPSQDPTDVKGQPNFDSDGAKAQCAHLDTHGPSLRRGRGGRGARVGRGRGRGRRAESDIDDLDLLHSRPKRSRVDLEANTLSLPRQTEMHASIGRFGAILEPDAGGDEADRRKATMAQAFLEPDGACGPSVAEMMFDHDEFVSGEARLHALPSFPLTPVVPPPVEPERVQITSLSHVAANGARAPQSLGVFDPLSSDEELPSHRLIQKGAGATSHSGVSLGHVAVNSLASVGGSNGFVSAKPVIGQQAAQSTTPKGLFFSDDEDD